MGVRTWGGSTHKSLDQNTEIQTTVKDISMEEDCGHLQVSMQQRYAQVRRGTNFINVMFI